MIEIEMTLAASPKEVWAAWTINSRLETWLTVKANVQSTLGGAFELFWEPDSPEKNSTLGCSITEHEPSRVLAFSWRGPSDFAHLMNVEPFPTHARVTLVPQGDSTLMRFVHDGWGDGEEWEQARGWQEKAWTGAFTQLKSMFS